MGGLKEDSMYGEDIDNLRSAEDLVNQLGNLETSLALTPASVGNVEGTTARRTSPRRTGVTTKNREPKEKGTNLKSVMMEMSEKILAVRVNI